jgi:hypothetical protein
VVETLTVVSVTALVAAGTAALMRWAHSTVRYRPILAEQVSDPDEGEDDDPTRLLSGRTGFPVGPWGSSAGCGIGHAPICHHG